MEREFNLQYFSREDVDNGLFNEFINTLINYGQKSDHYNDIHIKNEDFGAITVEWTTIPYSKEYGGEFAYVAENQVVMQELIYPNGSCEYVFPEECEDKFDEWLNCHSNWHMTNYGTWCSDEQEIIHNDRENN